MMKVHSYELLRSIEAAAKVDTNPRVTTLCRLPSRDAARSRPDPFTLVVTDGPFAESKESCLHVAIIAQRMRDE
jgi:hypothetical protein